MHQSSLLHKTTTKTPTDLQNQSYGAKSDDFGADQLSCKFKL